ncbi:hypothetical protein AB0H76_34180 [Nocardia sp. NPDC050712]|uniref:hypothetical protein n=1 Tax=Nocardia sp. NPDC050712 TaxID=3155518 RepID=UPI0033F56DDC
MTQDLPLFDLMTSPDALDETADVEWWTDETEIPDSFVLCLRVPGGRVLLTYWYAELHEVIFQTPADSEAAAAERNTRLFDHYSQGLEWNEVLDNGFGKTYERADQQLFAMWSYTMDYTTIGTADYMDARRAAASS